MKFPTFSSSVTFAFLMALSIMGSSEGFSINNYPQHHRAITHPPPVSLSPLTRIPARATPANHPYHKKQAASSTSLPLAQYAGQAIGLFNNMKTPASIIAGAIVPLGFLVPLQLKSEPDDTVWERRVRRCYQVLSVVTMATELIAVMFATVAVNQLTETTIAPAQSVWHLLQRDFALEWAAVNTHFVVGMLGFLAMIGSRAYFMARKGLLGKSVLGIAMSGLALMISIVNRGVAAGGGSGVRYGANVLALGTCYTKLFLRRATAVKSLGPIEITSAVVFVLSIAGAIKAVWNESPDDVSDEK